jgi:O-antigen/teichoic acid export membrane protein
MMIPWQCRDLKYIRKQWTRLSRSTLAINTGWTMAGYGLGLLLQGITFVALARLLGAVEFGVYAGAFALTNLVAVYGTMGTSILLVRYVCGNHKAFSLYWGNVLLTLACAGGLLICFLHSIGGHVLNQASYMLVTIISIGNCILMQLTLAAGRVFQAFDRMKITALLNLLTNLMRALASVAMLLTIHSATAGQWALVSTVVSGIAAVIAVTTVTFKFGWPKFDPRLMLKHGWEGFGYSLSYSAGGVYNDIDKTLLSHYGMNFANGIYSTAYRIVDIATLPIISLVFSSQSRFFLNGRSGFAPTATLSSRLFKISLPISIVAALLLFVSAGAIPRLAGASFAESALALRWLCLIPVFRSIHLVSGSSLTGIGRNYSRTVAQLSAAGINFGANLWLIPRYGWHGAAWSSLVSDGGLCIMYWLLLKAHGTSLVAEIKTPHGHSETPE